MSVRTRLLVGVLVTASVVAASYVERAAILRCLGSLLVHVDPLERSDAIVVLAGGTPSREIEGADLYQAGYAPEIVLTVGPEAAGVDVLRIRGVSVEAAIDERVRFLRELGIPASAIRVLADSKPSSTAEESELLFDWARTRRIQNLIIVTSRFHTTRAGLTYRRVFRNSGVTVRVQAASQDDFYPATWWQNRNTLRDGIFEWEKLVFYRLAYW